MSQPIRGQGEYLNSDIYYPGPTTSTDLGGGLVLASRGNAVPANPVYVAEVDRQLADNQADAEMWLARLAQGLVDRQPRYDHLENYVIGNHTLPDGDPRYVKALRELQQKSKTNYVALVTNAPCERMEVQGFRFGNDPDAPADEEANKIWQYNNMDLYSQIAHITAATFSRAYIMVSPPQDGDEYPIITVEDPRCTIVEHDPARPNIIRAGLKMWNDDIDGYVKAVVYLPDSIHYFRGRLGTFYQNIDYDTLKNRLVNTGNWEYFGAEPNPLGEVPIVPLNWRPGLHGTSMAEAEEGFSIQDRINATILDRMIISRAQAYKQRWAKGIKIPKTDSGQAKPPFDPGADILWAVESVDAQFGEFKEADITMILKAVRDDVGDLAAITKTPPHYLLGEIVNASGDALKAAETGLVSKTKHRIKTAGWTWEKVIKLAFGWMGDTSKQREALAETIWADPESRSRAELADAILKETQVGVATEIALERLGMTPAQIQRNMQLRRAEEMRQAVMMAAQGSMRPANPQGTGRVPTQNDRPRGPATQETVG
jgi:hypothetical protein